MPCTKTMLSLSNMRKTTAIRSKAIELAQAFICQHFSASRKLSAMQYINLLRKYFIAYFGTRTIHSAYYCKITCIYRQLWPPTPFKLPQRLGVAYYENSYQSSTFQCGRFWTSKSQRVTLSLACIFPIYTVWFDLKGQFSCSFS